jgi:hypothetical protein
VLGSAIYLTDWLANEGVPLSTVPAKAPREVAMAAVIPALGMILIIAAIFYAAWWNAYKRKPKGTPKRKD